MRSKNQSKKKKKKKNDPLRLKRSNLNRQLSFDENAFQPSCIPSNLPVVKTPSCEAAINPPKNQLLSGISEISDGQAPDSIVPPPRYHQGKTDGKIKLKMKLKDSELSSLFKSPSK